MSRFRRRLRLYLFIGLGLLVAAAGFAIALTIGTLKEANAASCQETAAGSGTYDLVLSTSYNPTGKPSDAGVNTLSLASPGSVTVPVFDGTTCSGTGALKSISLSGTGSALEIDETGSGGPLPCNPTPLTLVTGNIGTTPLRFLPTSGETLTGGYTTKAAVATTSFATDSCTSANVSFTGTTTGPTSVLPTSVEVDGNGAGTYSTAGSTATGGPIPSPATFAAAAFSTSGQERFYAGGAGSSIDFSQVGTSPTTATSGSLLIVNTTGTQRATPYSGTTTYPGYQASVGQATYAFANSTSQGSTDSNFTSFLGATTGGTSFLADGHSGLTLEGQGQDNAAYFYNSGSNPDAVNLSSSPQAVRVSSSSPPNTYSVAPGLALVASASPGGSCTTGALDACDALSDITTVGGPVGGDTTFYGGPTSVTFAGSGSGNDYVAGTASEVFQQYGSGSSNTVDFSQVPATGGSTLTVNLSPVTTATAPSTAVLLSSSSAHQATYDFTSGAAYFTDFIGSSDGNTTFDGGSNASSYTGGGSSPTTNTLDFSHASQTSLTLNVAGTTPSATLGGLSQSFSNIDNLVGLGAVSDTTKFVAGQTAGYTFDGSQSTSSATFASDPNPIVANLSGASYTTAATAGTATPVSVGNNDVLTNANLGGPFACGSSSASVNCDALVGITNVSGSTKGGNFFVAGPAAATFGDAGTAGQDTVDFSNVANGATPLVVNVTGGNAQGIGNNTATVGNTTYNFQSGPTTSGTDFAKFIGSSQGLTSFFAGPSPGYSFTGKGSNDLLDFSAITSGSSGVNVDLSGSTTSGTVALPGGGTPDAISGLTTIVGANTGHNVFRGGSASGVSYAFTGNGSGNDFYGGSSPDTFTASGAGNTFYAGMGNDMISGAGGSGDTVDFSQLPSSTALSVNATAGQVGSAASGTAVTATATYNFSSLGSAPIIFNGAQGNTTFYAGAVADRFNGYSNGSVHPANTLDFSTGQLTGNLVFCLVVNGPCATAGQAILGSTDEPFTNIESFIGLNDGSTSFEADGAGGRTFKAAGGPTTSSGSCPAQAGSGNCVDFSAAGASIAANLVTDFVVIGGNSANPDTISGIPTVIGAAVGNNSFVAGSGNETFGDPRAVPGGAATCTQCDSIDFSNVPDGAQTPLTVNASGQNVSGGNGPVPSYKASSGTYTYDFTDGGFYFRTFTTPSLGNTNYYANSWPGYTFNATGTNNTLSYADETGAITADLTTNTVSIGGGVDDISGLATIVGPPTGASTFIGASAPSTFTDTGNGNAFILHSGSSAITDPGSGNTLNLEGVGGALQVNVSGTGVGNLANDAATAPGATYTFSNVPTVFDGSTAGTTFYAGQMDGNRFNGESPTNDQLTFANISTSSSLALCAVPTGAACSGQTQAILGTTHQPFSGIDSYVGLPNGNTTFVGDGTLPTGETFTGGGQANTNTADFSSDATPITANVQNSTGNTVCYASCPSGSTVAITDIARIDGSTGGKNTFNAGPANQYFGDNGSAGADAIDFSAVPTASTSVLTVNTSGTPFNGVQNDQASVPGSYTWDFTTGGANFVKFYGAGDGFTHFAAPGAKAAYTFCATTNCGGTSLDGDVLDFSANRTGVNVDMVNGQATYPNGPAGQDTIGTAGAGNGFSNVIGAAAGPNAFLGDLTGATFTAASPTNTLSYATYPSGGVTVDLNADKVSNASGSSDTFSFTPGTLTVEGTPQADTFRPGSGTSNPAGGTGTVNLAGGGGTDVLDLSAIPAPPSGSTGAAVNLGTSAVRSGSVTGSTIGGITFTPGTAAPCVAASLCLGTITGSPYNDTVAANATNLTPAPSFNGGGGTDTVNLTGEASPATVSMPITAAGSRPASGGLATVGGSSILTFSGVSTVVGTAGGGDTFAPGNGTATFTENGSAPGTLDVTKIGVGQSSGASITVGQSGGVSSGSAVSNGLGINDTFTGIGTILGTPAVDTFTQTSDGAFNFDGEGGANVLNLSGLSSTVQVDLSAPTAECGPGATTNNGTATDGNTPPNVNDRFECMAQIITAGQQTFYPSQGQTASLNGGGNGVLDFCQAAPSSPCRFAGSSGLTITLPNGSTPGTVTGDGYKFTFTGMSSVIGSPNDDTFYPGSGTVTVNGGGGTDGLTYRPPALPSGLVTGNAPPAPTAGAVVNLSSAPYTVPTGSTAAGSTVQPNTATGGTGGTVTVQGMANVVGTVQYSDVLVGSPNPGSLIGGTGNTRFVPTGGDDYIAGGTGSATTLDLSALTGKTAFNLAVGTPQQTGDGLLTVVPGSIHTVIASNGGSQLFAGNGNVTLQGGPGNDYLAGGTGTQILSGGGGTDTLVAGTGTQTLNGGSAPVTFVPGGCGPSGAGSCSDTMTSTTTGNTLSYASATTAAAEVNLSPNTYSVPTGKPQGGTTLAGNTATGGNGATVNLAQAGITSVIGSPAADLVVTGPAPGNASLGDTVNGNGGNDLIVTTTGNNTLTATGGSTFLIDGAGNNTINGGGASTIDFSQAPAGVTVNLQAGSATGGFGGTQNLTGILNAIGTNYDDHLIAGAAGGTLTGLNAAAKGDVLQAGPSRGDTLISGGNGNDTFCAETSCAQAGTTAAGGDTMIGGSGNDTFFAANGVVDTVNGEGGFNGGTFDANDNVTNVQQGA